MPLFFFLSNLDGRKKEEQSENNSHTTCMYGMHACMQEMYKHTNIQDRVLRGKQRSKQTNKQNESRLS